MAGVSAHVPALDDRTLGNADQPCHVQAVVDWFGPTDFLKMDEQLAESGMAPAAEIRAQRRQLARVAAAWAGTSLKFPDLVRAANPETYLHVGSPPFFIQHGDMDDTVPHQQSVAFAAKARALLGAEQGHGSSCCPAPATPIRPLQRRRTFRKCWTSLITAFARSVAILRTSAPGSQARRHRPFRAARRRAGGWRRCRAT